jgi:hypothetical protein
VCRAAHSACPAGACATRACTRHKAQTHPAHLPSLAIVHCTLEAERCALHSWFNCCAKEQTKLTCVLRQELTGSHGIRIYCGPARGARKCTALVDGNRVTHGLASALEQTTYMLADDSGVPNTSPCASTLLTLLPQQLPGPASQAARQR